MFKEFLHTFNNGTVPISVLKVLNQHMKLTLCRHRPELLIDTHVVIFFRFTYIVIVSHVHPTVHHDVFASDGHEDAAATDILSSTLDREHRN